MKTLTLVRNHYVRLTIAVILLVTVIGNINSKAQAAELPEGATLTIPSLGIHAPIVEAYRMVTAQGVLTWNVSTLGMKIGHLENSAWLNTAYDGNIVLAGHSTFPNGAPSIFSALGSIANNAVIILSQDGTDYPYLVTEKKLVAVSDISVIGQTSDRRLTLLTCASDTTRWVIVAQPTSH